MSRESEEVVRRAYEAFNGRDSEAMRDLWTSDASWRPAFLGGGLVEGATYHGHEGLTKFIEQQGEIWDDLAVSPLRIRDVGDRVLVQVRLTGLGRASGIPVDQTAWHVFEFRGGRIAAGTVYATEAEAVEALLPRE